MNQFINQFFHQLMSIPFPRKNPTHLSSLSHPGDADYLPSPPSPSSLPPCEYGAACYRSNPLHRQQFSHDDRLPPRKARGTVISGIFYIFYLKLVFKFSELLLIILLYWPSQSQRYGYYLDISFASISISI